MLALITQQQARGHTRDGDAVDRLLDRTEVLAAAAAEHPEHEPAWVYFNGPERVLFQRGVAYVELGRHAAAVEWFDTARAWLPAGYRRDHGQPWEGSTGTDYIDVRGDGFGGCDS